MSCRSSLLAQPCATGMGPQAEPLSVRRRRLPAWERDGWLWSRVMHPFTFAILPWTSPLTKDTPYALEVISGRTTEFGTTGSQAASRSKYISREN